MGRIHNICCFRVISRYHGVIHAATTDIETALPCDIEDYNEQLSLLKFFSPTNPMPCH